MNEVQKALFVPLMINVNNMTADLAAAFFGGIAMTVAQMCPGRELSHCKSIVALVILGILDKDEFNTNLTSVGIQSTQDDTLNIISDLKAIGFIDHRSASIMMIPIEVKAILPETYLDRVAKMNDLFSGSYHSTKRPRLALVAPSHDARIRFLTMVNLLVTLMLKQEHSHRANNHKQPATADLNINHQPTSPMNYHFTSISSDDTLFDFDVIINKLIRKELSQNEYMEKVRNHFIKKYPSMTSIEQAVAVSNFITRPMDYQKFIETIDILNLKMTISLTNQ